MTRILAAIFLAFSILPALAQDNPEEEKSYFTSFLENQLSTPNRQIRISGIQGALSSNATIGSITVADREGVWLSIKNASIVWSRSALIFSQKLDIQSLSAESIDVKRKPLPEEGLPPPESTSFQLPELPIAVTLEKLSVPSVHFGKDLFGLESQLSIEGSIELADGALDTKLSVERIDGPGGQFRLAAAYANETRKLDLDLSLKEPADGIVANLAGIEGKPPLALTLKGSGPLDGLDLALTLDVEGQRTLDGTASLRRRDGGLGFSTRLSGPIARLVPPTYRDFFGATTTLTAEGVSKDGGGLVLDSLDLESAALKLAASAETSADNFLRKLSLDATIRDRDAQKVVLPVSGGETTVQSASLKLDFGQTSSEEWSGRLSVDQLTTDMFAARSVAIDMGGAAENLDKPDARHVSFKIDGAVSGITAERADIAEALGDRIDLAVDGDWRAGQPIELAKAEVSGNGLSASLAGRIADYAFDGDIAVKAGSIAPFSALAGRSLSGALDLKANGSVHPIGGGFDLTLDSTADELRIDNEAADNLLGGTTTITGRVARSEKGISADALKIENEQVEVTADGTFGSDKADFDFDMALADLNLVSKQAEGRLTAKGSAKGENGTIALNLKAEVPSGKLADKRLTEGALGFEGTLRGSDLDGKVSGDAFLDGVRIQLHTDVALADGVKRLSNLDFNAGGARATGNVTQSKDGLLDGNLSVKAPDISTAAALALIEASGSVNLDVTLSKAENKQNANVTGSVRDLKAGTVALGQADIQAAAEDLFGVPVVEGSVDARDLKAGGVVVTTLQARANRSGDTTDFSADAALDNGAEITTAGQLKPENGGYRLRLDKARLTQGKVNARLVDPATLIVNGSNISFDRIELDAAGGKVTAEGRIADDFDVSLAIDKLPLSIANAVKPDLELSGTIDGTATVSGPRDKPKVDFDITGSRLAAAALKQAGLSSLDVKAKGNTTAETLNVDAAITSPEGLNASAQGAVPLGEGSLDLDVKLNEVPVGIANAIVKGQDLGGRITGSAHVTGTLADPQARFDLDGSGLTARPLADFGAAPLRLSANGSYRGKIVTLSALRIDGPQGLRISASGKLPLAGNGLGLDVDGSIPLALANTLLAERGASVEGTLNVDANVSGSFAKPIVNGSFQTANARAIDPESHVRVDAINVSGGISGDTVTIRQASASLAAGGSISLSGTVSTNAAAGFPADITVRLDNAKYADGELVAATVNGQLALGGALMRDPTLSGNIDIERAEITVPSSFGGSAASIDVEHRNAPPAVRETLKRARAEDGTPMPSARPSILQVDITIDAPNKLFVRGRGLDAELGGHLRLTGPVTNISPVGGFELVRGRLSILGKRITFNEGMVTLIGDLDPFVDFTANSENGDIVVTIKVEGRVSDPDITFSSQPELPQDEVLARLIFNRGIDELSAFQLARLAAAAAELAGGSNNSLLGNLRNATGLDDLDVVTDNEGNTAVRAGRYIQDNIYLGVEAGTEGNTKGTINLDITEDLKAKGSVGAKGDSSVGLFYEKDY